MRDLLTWYLPCVLWLCAAGFSLREALAYRRARHACEAAQDGVVAALERFRAALEKEEDTHA